MSICQSNCTRSAPVPKLKARSACVTSSKGRMRSATLSVAMFFTSMTRFRWEVPQAAAAAQPLHRAVDELDTSNPDVGCGSSISAGLPLDLLLKLHELLTSLEYSTWSTHPGPMKNTKDGLQPEMVFQAPIPLPTHPCQPWIHNRQQWIGREETRKESTLGSIGRLYTRGRDLAETTLRRRVQVSRHPRVKYSQ